jgi:sensor histidine kinase YesM
MNRETKELNYISFQDRLQKLVRRRIVGIVIVCAILFTIGISLIPIMSAYKNANKNLATYHDAFDDIYSKAVLFITSDETIKLAKSAIQNEDEATVLSYPLYELNASWTMDANLIVSDLDKTVAYSSFHYSHFNMHKSSFNRAICDELITYKEERLYLSVYYGLGEGSEFVISCPIFEEGRVSGFLSLYLPGEKLEQQLAKANFDGIITDSLGRVIYSSRLNITEGSRKFIPHKTRGIITVNDGRYIINTEKYGKNIVIYSLVYFPKSYALYILAGVIVLLAGASLWQLTVGMSDAMASENAYAVKKLVSEISIISDKNPEHRISMETSDEFAMVGENINVMLDNIQALNSKNMELLKLKNQAEIGQLTAQLNPHFLYNTLENLRNAFVFDTEAADSIILNLTRILRYSIDSSEEEVLLREDLEYLECYLKIQKYRYGDRLSYEIAPEPDCMSFRLPKLILLTLVENSIKHGFKNRQKLSIWVDGYTKDGILYLSVTDDGCGMSSEEVSALNRKLLSEELDPAHRGLKNIARRLYLKYSGESGIIIRRLNDEGIQIVVKVQS